MIDAVVWPHLTVFKLFFFSREQELDGGEWLHREFTQLINSTTLPEETLRDNREEKLYTSLPIFAPKRSDARKLNL